MATKKAVRGLAFADGLFEGPGQGLGKGPGECGAFVLEGVARRHSI